MTEVLHFEIVTADPEKAVPFYANVFNWTVAKAKFPIDYWLVNTGEVMGGIVRRSGEITGIVAIIEVPAEEDIAAKIVENGGEVIIPNTL